jgi:hypothetical protein
MLQSGVTVANPTGDSLQMLGFSQKITVANTLLLCEEEAEILGLQFSVELKF